MPLSLFLGSLREPGRICQHIISGGQTGADRGALDFAIKHGYPHGGWAPRGRQAEDGTVTDGAGHPSIRLCHGASFQS